VLINDPVELEAWLTWLRAPGIGDRELRALVTREGGAYPALRAALAAPAAFGLSARTQAALRAPDAGLLARERAWLAQPGHAVVTFDDPDYPALLGQSPHAPAALFVAGQVELLSLPAIAIVGSRNATPTGLAHARDFARALCASGLGIVSGLALGADAAAHEAALGCGGRTIAVCATGLDRVYPERHRALAERIAREGALVSEFPLGTPARAPHFPRRNRIIAALALGTLVVEASLRSGSLITARLAAESGREVFALPGSLQNPLARGCHRLIRDGATLVECAGDVLEQLRPLVAGLRAELDADEPDAQPGDAPSGTNADPPADAEARRLLAALGHDPVTVDEAAARSGVPIARLAALLPLLELEGLVECLAGARYARVRGRAR